MESVFLDFETLDRDDIDVSELMRVLPGTKLFDSTPSSQIAGRIEHARFVILNKVRLSGASMEQARALKLVCLAATGTDNVDLEAARNLGVGVCNVRAYCTASVVQHVFAMILSLTQHLSQYQQLLKGGAWKDSPQFCMLEYPIRELQGRTLGVVGFGELGQAVARMGEAFGMRILVANRPGGAARAGRVDLPEVLAEADVLSLHCPLTPQTEGLLGAPELRRMKPDALLINTARGGLVDAEALAGQLREGKLGGAGIDVLREEPPVNGNVLIDEDIPNLIVTPHIAWAARESRQRALDEIVANIRDFEAGGQRGRVV